eukprot:jgi/Botrbrau1/12471/Bobra.0169s0018.1
MMRCCRVCGNAADKSFCNTGLHLCRTKRVACTSPHVASATSRGFPTSHPSNRNPLRHDRTNYRAPTCHAESSAGSSATVIEPPPAEIPPDAPNDTTQSPGGRSTAYPFSEIEAKWQRYWLENKTFKTPDLADLDTSKPKMYVLDMFPYPSGAGLHVGHPEGYTATDIIARLKRMQGYNVLHPIGWDAFGLPAEQYAVQTGTHPAVTTERNINRFRQQLQALGFSYDWDRELSTTDPAYYKWTQWIFSQLFKKGLAYQAEVPVNWCPALGTVLANEEVIDGKSERGGHPVVRIPMKQWMLRITAYADRLLEDLDELEWDSSIKDMQRNWIGRSEGASVLFGLQGGEGASVTSEQQLEVFTTRPDTLFGATYVVVAPEHPLLGALCSNAQRAEVEAYIAAALQKSDLERQELKTKSGVATGSYAINPVNGERLPVWVADYVLGSYGTGAIMAGDAELPFAGEGIAVDSSAESSGLSLNGMATPDAKKKVIEHLEAVGAGARKVNYKLRDWLFARQRYWGEPFPIVFPEGSEVPELVPEESLPLTLPETDDFVPDGTPRSPLAKITDWIEFTDPATGRRYIRETSTMPQWAGSCWYYIRYLQPWNAQQLVDPQLEKYWLPVDLYVGGAEHAVLHLLYARFWHKVLYDLGVVSYKEPFRRLVSQGMILGEVEYTAFKDPDGAWVDEQHPQASPVKLAEGEVEKTGQGYVLKSDPTARVSARAHKMSKSRGNVVNPDDIVDSYGADSLRLYEMFMGPLRETKVWSTDAVGGVHRFLARVYRLITASPITDAPPTPEQLRLLHAPSSGYCSPRFSRLPLAALNGMIVLAPSLKSFVAVVAICPSHWLEELWQVLGAKESLAYEQWPEFDASLLVEDTFNLPVQVNGKLRGTVEVSKNVGQEELCNWAWQCLPLRSSLARRKSRRLFLCLGGFSIS